MNKLVYAERALDDLQRLVDFLQASDLQVAFATVNVIFSALEVLLHSPEIGQKVPFGNRELVISRGRTGYLALYKFFPESETVLVLALRHQREAGYSP